MFNLDKLRNQSGFTLMELLVTLLLVSMLSIAGGMLLIVGENAWSTTSSNIYMQDNIRATLQRISSELQQSGKDSSGAVQVFISDNVGVNNSDILRFAIPLCLCGVLPMDSNGNVKYWGASLVWGQSGCSDDYPVDNNNKVTICHLSSGNSGDEQTMSVDVNAVKAHLAHGDRIGDCSSCSLASYTNHFIEYRINSNNQFVRRVLDSDLSVVNEIVIDNFSGDFQVTLDADQMIVTLSLDLTRNTSRNRTLTMSDSIDINLRNRG